MMMMITILLLLGLIIHHPSSIIPAVLMGHASPLIASRISDQLKCLHDIYVIWVSTFHIQLILIGCCLMTWTFLGTEQWEMVGYMLLYIFWHVCSVTLWETYTTPLCLLVLDLVLVWLQIQRLWPCRPPFPCICFHSPQGQLKVKIKASYLLQSIHLLNKSRNVFFNDVII